MPPYVPPCTWPDKGLVLVDPGHSPTMARLLRAATRAELGRDQFAYVIGQHEIRPRERLTGMRDYLAWLWPAVEHAEAEGLHLEDTIRLLPAGDFVVDEAALNLLGYRFLGEGHVEQAIAVFEINADAFPTSWNVSDSLGEAWLAAGDRERAAELYRRSLELNPGNANGRAALERIAAMPPGR